MSVANFVLFKDFAGPFATVIASATAAFVTFKIQDENRRLKRDELRLSLFNRRYSVYESTLAYIRYIKGQTKHDLREELSRSQDFARVVLESRFTCSASVQNFLGKIQTEAFNYAASLDELNDASTQAERVNASSKKREISNNLEALVLKLPTVFERDLRLRYLD